jgi:hypothetical protein
MAGMRTRPFPLDLVRLQRAWNHTQAALQRRPAQTGALRGRLEQLASRIDSHPFWQTSAGRPPAARVELRQYVRELQEAEARLTVRQARILACIQQSARETGKTPSMRDICRQVGLSSTGSVSYQLDQMTQLGVIGRSRLLKGRGIALRW